MKKQALLKSSIREIKNSPGRFFSILGIIFLGVAFFVGIGATGPDMLRSADQYYQKHQLADFSLISSLGLTDEDKKIIENDSSVEKVVFEKLVDIQQSTTSQVFRLYSYKKNQPLNQLKVISGRLPEKEDEILLDNNLSDQYKLDEELKFLESDDPDDQLSRYTFKIVGFVTTPEFVDVIKRGNTTVGNGSIDSFAYVPEKNFKSEVYSRALISFKEARNVAAYSKEYDEFVKRSQKELETKLEPRKQARLNEIKEEAEETLNKNQKKITNAKQKIEKAQKDLKTAEKELEEGKKTYQSSKQQFEQEIAKASEKLAQSERQLNQSQQKLQVEAKNIDDAQTLIEEKEKELQASEQQVAEALEKKPVLTKAIADITQLDEGFKTIVTNLNALLSVPEEVREEPLFQIKAQLEEMPLTGDLKQMVTRIIATMTVTSIETSSVQLNHVRQELKSEQQKLRQQLAQLEESKQQLILGRQQFEQEKEKVSLGKAQIVAAELKIKQGKKELEEGKAQLANEKEKGLTELAKAEKTLIDGEKQLAEGKKEFEETQRVEVPKLEKAQKKLTKEKEKIVDMQPATFTIINRETNPGYEEYKQNANRITSIATVFPTIFFLIAALVSLTTMGRMIEEKRVEIGTFKALGYKNKEIAQKFLIYSATAGILGSFLGLALGFYLFPNIIIRAYGQLYNMKEFITPWYWNYSLIALAVGLVCTVGIAMVALRVDLFSTPASLLRPKAPKAGKRILIERATFIWKRLSFNQKVTMRNLFRYKSRMLMTIFGIAGCTAMIVTGFGLKDSITDIAPIQFTNIWKYQGIVTFDDLDDQESEQEFQRALSKIPDLKETIEMNSESLTIEGHNQTAQDIMVYTPKNPEELRKFVLLQDRKTNEKREINDQGAVINEKLAKLFSLEVGDTFTIKNADHEKYTLTVAAVAENYVGHFAYLTPTYYQKVFNQEPKYNTELLLFKGSLTKKEEREIANTLMKQEKVMNVSFLSDSSSVLDDTTNTLNIVVWVLIISAGLLAFIVLYNLNNINISERIRELSTIKVLGFFDNEVTMYIYRENILLTIIGIGVGIVLGKTLHGYVLQTVELDMLMFSPIIHKMSYVFASLITITFTVIVGIVMYLKLKKVDMIEALKSNE